MKIIVDNIGAIKHAELVPGDITVICGKNNSGKTYVTYAYYGFLNFLKTSLIEYSDEVIDLSDINTDELKENKILEVNIGKYLNNYSNILDKICDIYSKTLYKVFASTEKRFKNSKFQIILDDSDLLIPAPTKIKYGDSLVFNMDVDKKILFVSYINENDTFQLPPSFLLTLIGHTILRVLFKNVFGLDTFIASVERTGASIFKKELYLNRNRIVEKLSESTTKDKDIDIHEFLFSSYSLYPLPVKDNVTFIQGLDLLSAESPLSQSNPEILAKFSEIVGGTYGLDKDGDVIFTPKLSKSRSPKLQLTESSSVARALIHIDYYLRHRAQKNENLIVDEPELNLHPENQRLIARLFVRLANAGIKVFITTHSDYIIREFNTLILLNQNNSKSKAVMDEYGYEESEVLNPKNIKIYVTEQYSSSKSKKPNDSYTLAPVHVDDVWGISISSFDVSINMMNEIQDKLLWY